MDMKSIRLKRSPRGLPDGGFVLGLPRPVFIQVRLNKEFDGQSLGRVGLVNYSKFGVAPCSLSWVPSRGRLGGSDVKRNYKVPVAMLAGIALGSLGMQMLKAQKSPTAFYIAEVFEVSNQDQYNTYAAGVPATVEKYGGHYVVRGGKTEALEGEPPKRIVVLAFKSMADAQRWCASPEYSAIRPIRLRSAKARGFIVEGLGE